MIPSATDQASKNAAFAQIEAALSAHLDGVMHLSKSHELGRRGALIITKVEEALLQAREGVRETA